MHGDLVLNHLGMMSDAVLSRFPSRERGVVEDAHALGDDIYM